MAEPGIEGGPQPLVSNRILITAVSVILLVIVVFFLWTFRGCVPGRVERGYTTIYSNLDLKDAANVITRLKELKIPYELKESGTLVAVPKDRADEARLGLAVKNLPAGGMVGWEIFNETRMGATDFDRRIQLIRAISGELSRNIRRIAGVEDARVQIVIPETRLFEVTKAPVTAAVLLKLAPGAKLKPEQISGIIHLTASSVENLKPEDVTVVDESGNILSARVLEAAKVLPELMPSEVPVPAEKRAVKKELEATAEGKVKEVSPIKEAAKEVPPRPLTQEEKILLKLKAKEEYERQLTAKIQEILNQLYPPNGVITKVVVEYGMPSGKKVAKLKIKANSEFLTQPIKKIKVFVLVDMRVPLSDKLKKLTYQTVAEVVGYDRSRNDRIILKKVPFHYAVTPALPAKPEFKMPFKFDLIYLIFLAAGVLLILFIVLIFRPKKAKKIPFEMRPLEEIPSPPTETEAASVIGEIKKMAASNPEKIANLLKRWLTEE